MACHLLHIVEQQDRAQYSDRAVKDVVGVLPEFYCAHCSPLRRLKPGEAMKCIERSEPCWMPPDRICADRS